jgi:hypothetical protein
VDFDFLQRWWGNAPSSPSLLSFVYYDFQQGDVDDISFDRLAMMCRCFRVEWHYFEIRVMVRWLLYRSGGGAVGYGTLLARSIDFRRPAACSWEYPMKTGPVKIIPESWGLI